MKKFVKILFGGAILSYALSTIAMDTHNNEESGSFNIKKAEVQQPLKFKVDPMTGNVEDTEGNHLIDEYRSAVRNICAVYGEFEDKVQAELKDLEVTLKEMSKDSDEYFATEIYKNKRNYSTPV